MYELTGGSECKEYSTVFNEKYKIFQEDPERYDKQGLPDQNGYAMVLRNALEV